MCKIKFIEIERGRKTNLTKIYYLIELDPKYIYLANELLHDETSESICGYTITYTPGDYEYSTTAHEMNVIDRNYIIDVLLQRRIIAVSENSFVRGYVRGDNY